MNVNLIVALSKNYAVKYDDSCPDSCPFASKDYYDIFEEKTKDGVVIMGRNTYESLPLTKRPLGSAVNIVLSNDHPKYGHLNNERLVFADMFGLMNRIAPQYGQKQFWVIGGLSVYEALWNQCNKIVIVHLDKNAPVPGVSSTSQTDRKVFFPDISPVFELQSFTEPKWSEDNRCKYRVLHYVRNSKSKCAFQESQYLQTLRNLLLNGQARDDRTGVGTLSLFGGQQTYDVSQYLPLLTTKFVPINLIIKELLWFLSGSTDAKVLQSQGVHIWDGNSSREFLDKRGLDHYEVGDIGPMYGHLWTSFGSAYEGCDKDYAGKGYDQIRYVLDLLRNDPFSRRILMTAWNPPDLDKMALAPCHVLFQLYVEEDPNTHVRYVSGHLYQRSSDYFLAANYNLVSYTILLYILCKKVGYYPKNMIMSFGDCHIYKNHVEQVKTQLGRNPRPQPILLLNDSITEKDLRDITVADFELVGYLPQPAIKATMAI